MEWIDALGLGCADATEQQEALRAYQNARANMIEAYYELRNNPSKRDVERVVNSLSEALFNERNSQ